MTDEYETRTMKLIVGPKGEPIYDERCYTVEIVDEAAGEFVRVHENMEQTTPGEILIEAKAWPPLRDAIETMIQDCRGYGDDHD